MMAARCAQEQVPTMTERYRHILVAVERLAGNEQSIATIAADWNDFEVEEYETTGVGAGAPFLDITSTPEPTSLMLPVLGLAGVVRCRKR